MATCLGWDLTPPGPTVKSTTMGVARIAIHPLLSTG